MKRLFAWLEPLSSRERRREAPSAQRWGEGSGSHDRRALSVPSPAPSGHPLSKGEGKGRFQRVKHALVVALVTFVLTFSAVAFAIDPLPFRSEAQRDRFQHLTGELRCMVCQDESLLASNADFAKQLRRQIFDMMQQGKSDKEIKDWLVARYSTFILYDPPLAPSTVALWFGTPAILLAGGIVVAVLLRRRTRPAHAIAEEPGDDW